MKKTTKQQRSDFEDLTIYGKKRNVDELVALFCNAVEVQHISTGDELTPESFIVLELLTRGEVGKYHGDNTFYRLLPKGKKDRYGRPTTYNLATANGKTVYYDVKREDVSVYRANAISAPYLPFFESIAEQMAIMDNAMRANLLNSMTSRLIVVDGDEALQTVNEVIECLYAGIPAVPVIKGSIDGQTIADSKEIAAPFIADRIHELQRAVWCDALKRCGIMTSDAMKVERVSTAQTNAGVGESIDYIYTMIDTFNADAKMNGEPERMQFKGYTAEYDQPEDKMPDGTKQNEQEEQEDESRENA